MKNKKDNFIKLCEDTIYRFQSGGLMPGDIVKFRKNALKHQSISEMSQQYLDMIKNAMDTDLNLRVGSVKSMRPNTTGNYGGGSAAGQGTDAAADFYVDIVVEYAPGLWRDPITVPIEVLERIDTGINMAPVPDSLKKQTPETKPQQIITNDPDRTNPKSNTTLPSVAPQDGRDQIQNLEEAYDAIYEAKFNTYTLEFNLPYGAEPRDRAETTSLIKTLKDIFGPNIMLDWVSDKILKITCQHDIINPKEVEDQISDEIKGTVSIWTPEDKIMTKPMDAPGLY